MSVALRSISKSYGSQRVLHPLSLEVARGELLAVLGPSGCGKTTTLRIVAGLETADEGIVEIDGTDVTRIPPERRGLGMVFQHYAVWPHRNVAENVAYPLERAGAGREERARRVNEALALVHLDGLAGRRPHQLSGGQLQRVALARAIVIRPRVLLLDEPLSNLDAALRDEMRSEIRALQRRLDITTILVTHDQVEALSMADRVAVMSQGRLEQFGTPAAVYDQPATAFVARFVGGGNVVTARCDGGRIHLGKLELPALRAQPGEVQLVVRPEDIRLDDAGAEAKVLQRLYQGDRVELRLDLQGIPLRALVPARDAAELPPDGPARISIGRFTVLEADASAN